MAALTQVRRDALRRLLIQGEIRSQEEAVSALSAQGIGSTQSAISRDLRLMGAIRQNGRYVLPEAIGAFELDTSAIISASAAGPNLLVVRTLIGAASRVALEIDQQNWPDIVGTIAGDDTIFLATPNAMAQSRITKRLISHA